LSLVLSGRFGGVDPDRVLAPLPPQAEVVNTVVRDSVKLVRGAPVVMQMLRRFAAFRIRWQADPLSATRNARARTETESA
jgi:hypothetical protein